MVGVQKAFRCAAISRGAVAPDGKIYVSVQGGSHPGVQVYDAKGKYLSNLPDAPTDFHGFRIVKGEDGRPYIIGARVAGMNIVKMTLDGKVVLDIPPSKIPDKYKRERNGELRVSLTGVAVAPNGDIFVTDGYGLNFIHRFDKGGEYLGTFGGNGPPWNFKICHKIAIDTRFQPVRLNCADREHNRIVQMDLQGKVLKIIEPSLRQPTGMDIRGSEMAVPELGGRVSILDKDGNVLAKIGNNDDPNQRATNEVAPEKWQDDTFYAPHGAAFTNDGNLVVAEWNKSGRLTFVTLNRGAKPATASKPRKK